MSIKITCKMCKIEKEVNAKEEDIKLWKDGMFIQKALPYLSAGDRELLISHICGDCFDKLFEDDE